MLQVEKIFRYKYTRESNEENNRSYICEFYRRRAAVRTFWNTQQYKGGAVDVHIAVWFLVRIGIVNDATVIADRYKYY